LMQVHVTQRESLPDLGAWAAGVGRTARSEAEPTNVLHFDGLRDELARFSERAGLGVLHTSKGVPWPLVIGKGNRVSLRKHSVSFKAM
jgi:hypothetical protein